MSSAAAETCPSCGYDLRGVPLNEFGRCTCPECGHTESPVVVPRFEPLQRRNHAIVSALLGSILPAVLVCLMSEDTGRSTDVPLRLGLTIWGLVISPPLGGIAALTYALLVGRAWRRVHPHARITPLTWICVGTGLLAGFAAMIIAAILMAIVHPSW